MPIVHKLQTGFMLLNALITNVNWFKSFTDYMSTEPTEECRNILHMRKGYCANKRNVQYSLG